MRAHARPWFVGMAILGLAAAAPLPGDPATAPRLSSDDRAALASSLHWQTGTVRLQDGLATLNLAPGYRALDSADGEKVLHEIWGNPAGSHVLGMVFPPGSGPLDRGGWALTVEYEEGGYIKDDDAGKLDYPALLQQMQKAVQNGNDERQRLGYPAVTLMGWAQPPHYDAPTHKLYWAKDVRFAGSQGDTLNYNIRVLGRRGVLILNAISSMDDFDEVNAHIPQVLSMVEFQPGNRYADFDPKVDKIAKYGLATLIAGGALGVAAKAGLFKFLWPLLLFLKKFVLLAVVAVVAFFKRISAKMSGRKTTQGGLPPQQRP